MSLTLKQIADRVLDVIGLALPSSYTGNTDATARRIVAIANDLLLEIQDSDTSWILATKLHSFTTVASQAGYSLPSDYKRIANRTAWDNTNFQEMGALNFQQWQSIKASILSSRAGARLFQIQADAGVKKFFVDPTPTTTGDTLSFWYMGSDVVVIAGGVEGDSPIFTTDNDTCIYPDRVMIEGIKYKMLARLGFSYIEELSQYQAALGAAMASDGALPDIVIGGEYGDKLIGYDNIPETGYGN